MTNRLKPPAFFTHKGGDDFLGLVYMKEHEGEK